MGAYNIPSSILRIAGAASILAGILMIAGFILHPAGEDATFGTDPYWIPAHGLLWLAFTIALLAWIGLYVVQASKAGRLGVAAFIIVIVGTSLASFIFSSDVTFVPVIAKESPGLFRKIFSNTHIAIGLVSVLTWVLGNARSSPPLSDLSCTERRRVQLAFIAIWFSFASQTLATT
jgi:hypothetical protein